MTLSQRIAEAKGWYFERSDRGLYVDKETLPITDYSNGQKTCDKALTLYSPETNKAQGMDLLIELIELDNVRIFLDIFRFYWEDKKAGVLTAICKAWLAAFGEV